MYSTAQHSTAQHSTAQPFLASDSSSYFRQCELLKEAWQSSAFRAQGIGSRIEGIVLAGEGCYFNKLSKPALGCEFTNIFRAQGIGSRAEGIVLADESPCQFRHCEQSIDYVAIQTPFCKGYRQGWRCASGNRMCLPLLGCQALPDRGIFNNSNYSNNSNHSNNSSLITPNYSLLNGGVPR